MSQEPQPPRSDNITIFETGDGRTRVEVRFDHENVWLTQTRMADLYEGSTDNISLHLRNTPHSQIRRNAKARRGQAEEHPHRRAPVRHPKGAETPRTVAYPRNPDLDPQLVWRGKDEQDWSDLGAAGGKTSSRGAIRSSRSGNFARSLPSP